jgi:4-diphosphocytidyl-2-C-methyl-D-erythritol kinase
MPWMHCPAKLNLTLHLLGLRPDGYTNLESWVAKLALHDTLSVGLRVPQLTDALHTEVLEQGLYFSSDDAYLQTLGENNLVIRAVRSIQAELTHRVKTPPPWPKVHVHLEKNLPYQAGLGSASSNAATALIMANTCYSHHLGIPPLPLATLMKLGAAIGSDVPLFLQPDAALIHMQGRGEIIQQTLPKLPKPLETLHLIIAKLPEINIPTGEAFALVHQQQAYSQVDASSFNPQAIRDLNTIPSHCNNDFEPIALALRPELGLLYQAFHETGALHTLLCGSGSAVAGFYPSLPQEGCTTLQRLLPEHAYCVATRFIGS